MSPMPSTMRAVKSAANRTRIAKHLARSRRLTGMQAPIRPIAFALARSLAMVAVAILLILVLLPAAIAAQAATAV
jgi:hypothetical protein